MKTRNPFGKIHITIAAKPCSGAKVVEDAIRKALIDSKAFKHLAFEPEVVIKREQLHRAFKS